MDVKTVHLAVYETLADWEYGHAVAHINNPRFQRRPGAYRVRTVAGTAAPITTLGGLRVTPDLTVDDLDPADSAMLIMPGAGEWQRGNAVFARAARSFLSAGVPVAAICGATYALAREGLLNDRDHTSNALSSLTKTRAYTGTDRYRDEPAVRDRGLVTAGATGSLEFAREIFAELELYTPEALDAWYGFQRTGDPKLYFRMAKASAA
ncbi:DJ-1/PfpI family protein [Microbispora sp. RL4-1S]|uniref:DJ-1/PfpI family protein n=1 Tax=Microbispora oryzae TaxID=2806554 RepID=A0A940WKN6_9ACTN|nr:DJ-1/PfpI family protein [Microbispora oryzae]MBP2703245.1 DJ-1/PfpI family protein [Microbispora oryzae]